MHNLDDMMKSIIYRFLSANYIVDWQVYHLPHYTDTCGDEIKQLVSMIFDIDDDGAHLVTYNWLYDNGMRNIQSKWFGFIQDPDQYKIGENSSISGDFDIWDGLMVND